MSGISSDDYKKGMLLADDFKKELNEWLSKRKIIINLLNHVAFQLDEIQRKCDIAEVTGASVAAAGSLCIIGASVVTFLTGGLASPLLVGAATATAALGTTTVVVTEIIKNIESFLKEKDIDKLMKEDAEAIERVERRYNELKSYSGKKIGSKWFMGGIVCFLSSIRYEVFIQITKAGEKTVGLVTFGHPINIIKDIRDIINVVTSLLEGFGEIVSKMMLESIITGVCAAVVLGFSIAAIVKTSISIHGGSKSEAANKIRKIVKGFNKQLESAEKLLHAIK